MMPELRVVSTTWPWDHSRFTVDQVLAHLVALKADEVCIRTPAYYDHYDDPNDDTYHDRLAAGARALGMKVSLWAIVSLYYPEWMADSIHREYDRYKPDRITLDAERKWVNLYGANTARFLEVLGRMPCPVGLGSYRRPSLNSQIKWQTWLKAKSGGDYIIDFQGAQLYPIGWLTANGFVYQYRLDIDSHELQHQMASRPDIQWLPFVPAFSEGLDPYGNLWYPRVDAVKAAVEYMRTRLGSRLVGVNWWSFDQDMAVDTRLKPVYDYLTGVLPPPQTYNAKVKAGTLNVRKGPGMTFSVVGQLKFGTLVTVVEESTGWGRIGDERWVSVSWLTKLF